MKYRVIVRFTDLKDKDYKYEVGDEYPRKGGRTTKKRIAELSSTENRRGMALIEPIEDEE